MIGVLTPDFPYVRPIHCKRCQRHLQHGFLNFPDASSRFGSERRGPGKQGKVQACG